MPKFRVPIERSAVETSYIDIDADNAEHAEQMVDQMADHQAFRVTNPTEFVSDTESVWVECVPDAPSVTVAVNPAPEKSREPKIIRCGHCR